LASASDKGHQVLASELAADAKAAYAHFKAGQTSQARFFLSDVAGTCLNCHTSRSSSHDSSFSVDFNKDLHWEGFEPLAKARFLALSRQFEAASHEYEKLFLSQALSADEFVNLDPIVEYLIIDIRVRNDPASALKTLEAMNKSEYPALIKEDLASWTSALKRNRERKGKSGSLAQAKVSMRLAHEMMQYPQDRSGLVDTLFASRDLHDFIQSKSISSADKAEAYYLLGICEFTVGASLFADESIGYFEEAIRLRPKTDIARKAYARFEENILFGYSGSSGVHLPDEEKRRLNELKKLAY
jgi:hypothetical protein